MVSKYIRVVLWAWDLSSGLTINELWTLSKVSVLGLSLPSCELRSLKDSSDVKAHAGLSHLLNSSAQHST